MTKDQIKPADMSEKQGKTAIYREFWPLFPHLPVETDIFFRETWGCPECGAILEFKCESPPEFVAKCKCGRKYTTKKVNAVRIEEEAWSEND